MTMDADVFARRAAGLEWLLFDVDGVLTNGLLLYTRRGEQVKLFHVRDGLGFRLAQQAGLKVGLFSGRRSRALERRAVELDCDAVILGTQDKRQEFDKFLDDYATAPAKVAYVADDLPDLPVLGRCALSFAPADAVEEVRAVVHVVLASRGRRGGAGDDRAGAQGARGLGAGDGAVFAGLVGFRGQCPMQPVPERAIIEPWLP